MMDEYTCDKCWCVVKRVNRERHEEFHNGTTRLPVEVLPGARVQSKPEYGIEFHDEAADAEHYDTLTEALRAYEDYQAARELHDGTEDEDYEGLRLMTRSITTIYGPWVPFRRA